VAGRAEGNDVASMKSCVREQIIPRSVLTRPLPEGSYPPDPTAPTPRGPIEFRFVLKFAAQLSTPCSRGMDVSPRADRLLVRAAPRLFQSYLQRYSVLQ
jgi:hypothetical protein